MERLQEDWPVRVDRWRELATATLVLAAAFAIPLVFRPDPVDMFRLPKTLFFRAEAMLLASVTLAALLLGAPVPRPKWRDPWLLVPLAALAILGVLTLTSTNRRLSVDVFWSATATAVVYFATVATARRRGWIMIAIPLVAAVTNAVLVIMEETNLWMPFGVHRGIPHHLQCNALVGNPNEVGGYLGAALLAALAAMSMAGEKDRWSFGTAAAAIGAGLIACRTLTAIVAFAVAGFFMIAIRSWKKAIQAAAVAVLVAAILVALMTPFRKRATNVVRWARTGQYNAIFTDRFTPFVAAWSMFVDHPLTGVGPGAFAWQYYEYKLEAEQRYPSLRGAYNRGVNYGEVHNDHLQVLAEGGVVGYCAFLALIGALASCSFTVPRRSQDVRQRFARGLALTLALFWIVLSIAQFPLESTVVLSLLVHLAAVCVAWRSS